MADDYWVVKLENTAPTTPSTPTGPTSGLAGTSYSYSTSATDSDIGDTLTYTFDWGDTTTTVTGAVASGTPVSQSHTWATAGTHLVRVKATDSNGISSGWSGTLSVTMANPNTAPTKWQKLLGGSGSDLARSVQQTGDGGYIVAGDSTSSASGNVTGTNHGGNDYWIVRLDSTGNIVWQKLLGGSGDDIANSVQQTADGGYIVAGNSGSSASGDVTGTNHGGGD